MARANRRTILGGIASATGVGLAGCLGDDDDDADDTDDTTTPADDADDADDANGVDDSDDVEETLEVTLQLPEGTIHYPMYEAAQDAGIFADQGIDVTIEYPPFDAQVASITSGEVDTTMVSLLPYVSQYLLGEELVNFGYHGTLQSVNAMYCLAERDYETIADVEGDRIGVWSWGSSTVQAFEAIVADEFGLQLQQDFETTTAAPPALVGLLQEGEVDAIINVSGLTITMESQPETFRNIGYLNGMWIDRTNYPLPLTGWFAYEDWYDENEDLAARLLRAGEAATGHWRENTVEILEEYGEPGGVEGEAEIDVVNEWANEGHVFMDSPDQGYIDATWEALELMHDQGFIDEVPAQEDILRDPL